MICRNCKKDLPKSKFYKIQSQVYSKKADKVKSYLNYAKDCRECCSSKDGLYKVYLIYNDKYVGITANIKRRMSNHKKNGKDISRVYVLIKTKSIKLATFVESFLHLIGFKGIRSSNKYL